MRFGGEITNELGSTYPFCRNELLTSALVMRQLNNEAIESKIRTPVGLQIVQ